jgi:hypothetical protein
MSNTLIMACCANKLETRAPVRALELYQSRAFNLVRERALPGDWQILILSALYGLVPAHVPLQAYDRRMDEDRVRELLDRATAPLGLRAAPGTIHVFGGELYRRVIRTWCQQERRACVEVIGAGRGCGDHYSALTELMK